MRAVLHLAAALSSSPSAVEMLPDLCKLAAAENRRLGRGLTVYFEWDIQKNKLNINKHGLDFADAPEVFLGPLLTNLDTRQDYGEDRWIGIGYLRRRVVVIVFTESEEDTIRILSMRKATNNERIKFEETIRDQLETD